MRHPPIAFVCALPLEARAVRRAGCGPVVVGGVGAARSAAATRELIGSVRPAAVLSVGLCGALAGGPAVGDLIAGTSVVTVGGELFPCGLVPPAGHTGTMLTVPSMVAGRAERADLHRRTGAVAVDMESAGVARVCRQLGVPFGVLRAVSDDAGDDLPEGLEPFLRLAASPSAKRCVVAGAHLLRRPGLVAHLLRLRRRAAFAADRLGIGLAPFAPELAPGPAAAAAGPPAPFAAIGPPGDRGRPRRSPSKAPDEDAPPRRDEPARGPGEPPGHRGAALGGDRAAQHAPALRHG